MTRIGVYPGSFNPPTLAHVAIADAARRQRDLDLVVLTHSHRVLGKDVVERPRFHHRVEVLDAVAAEHDWLHTDVTTHTLLVDIADGFDVVVMGADKWHQIQELQWYADASERDAALARLPEVAVAPRPPLSVPAALRLEVEPEHIHDVSSTAARSGALGLMAGPARAFAERTGAWVDDRRYERWLATQSAR